MSEDDLKRRTCELCRNRKAQCICSGCGAFVCEACTSTCRPETVADGSSDAQIDKFLDSIKVRCRRCQRA